MPNKRVPKSTPNSSAKEKSSEHVWEVHKGCERPYCNVCEGGLAICTVCGLAEGALTTHCPGTWIDTERADGIYEGLEDYRDGAWIVGASPHSPAAYRDRKIVKDQGKK